MNTEGLKPIDARTMKTGDPVVRKDGTPGRLVAHIPEARAAYRALFMFSDNKLPTLYTEDGRVAEGGQHQIFLPPDPDPEDPDPVDPDPVDPSPGNTRGLRKSQIPPGYRIAAHSEGPNRRAKYWSTASDCAVDRARPMDVYCPLDTYLVPIAPIRMVPLEMKDFIGKPWPLVRKVTSQNTQRAVYLLSSVGIGVSTIGEVAWEHLRIDFELSHDDGVTWVKAEKEEQPK